MVWDLPSGQLTPIANPEGHLSNNRFNDGKCDVAGRFWAGTMALDVLMAIINVIFGKENFQPIIQQVTGMDYLIWQEMYGNGVMIGSQQTIILLVYRITPEDQRLEPINR